MSEKEMLLLVRLVTEDVADIQKGRQASSFQTLKERLRKYSEEYDREAGSRQSYRYLNE